VWALTVTSTRTCRSGDVRRGRRFCRPPARWRGPVCHARRGGRALGRRTGWLPDDLIDGISEGEPDGFPNGELDGLRDGISEGEPDRFHAGELDGSLDGVSESELKGVTDGEMSRSFDGSSDGEPDALFVRPTGRCDSSKGVQRGPHVKPSSPRLRTLRPKRNIAVRAGPWPHHWARRQWYQNRNCRHLQQQSCRHAIYGCETRLRSQFTNDTTRPLVSDHTVCGLAFVLLLLVLPPPRFRII
jgi:hypothetical protein